MNIQPISAGYINIKNYKVAKSSNNYNNPTFKGEENNNIDKRRIANAMKALALSSAVAFTPAMISCGTDELNEYCDHPNHMDPPYPSDSTNVGKDTIYTGKTYETPEIKMLRYKVDGNDTTKIGSVTFSKSIIHVPYNAHKSSELQTVAKFIDILGLKTKNINKEYAATKSFDYNMIPAQLTWLNERTGTVNQLKYNGYDSKDNKIKMDLISIPADSNPIERQLNLIVAGNNKLLVHIFDKEGIQKYDEQLYTLDNDTISQFNINENNNFEKICEYSKGKDSTTVSVKDRSGNKYNLANFDVLTAISEEK